MEPWVFMELPHLDPAMTALLQTRQAMAVMYPVEPAPVMQQAIGRDGGFNGECFSTAMAAFGTYGLGVLGAATADTGLGAAAFGFAAAAVGASTYSAVSACFGPNASANNGNGSAGPGDGN